jgi:hypothetical protein
MRRAAGRRRPGQVVSSSTGCRGRGGDEGLAARLLLGAEVTWRPWIGAPCPDLPSLVATVDPRGRQAGRGAVWLASTGRGRGEPRCKDGGVALGGSGVVFQRLGMVEGWREVVARCAWRPDRWL